MSEKNSPGSGRAENTFLVAQAPIYDFYLGGGFIYFVFTPY